MGVQMSPYEKAVVGPCWEKGKVAQAEFEVIASVQGSSVTCPGASVCMAQKV